MHGGRVCSNESKSTENKPAYIAAMILIINDNVVGWVRFFCIEKSYPTALTV